MPTGSAALQWHVNRAPLVGDQKSAALQIAHAGSRARVARMVSLCGAAPLGAPRALRNSPLPQWAARWRCERAASASAKASVCLGGKNKREREREREERRSRGQTHKADSARSLPRRPPSINRAFSEAKQKPDALDVAWPSAKVLINVAQSKPGARIITRARKRAMTSAINQGAEAEKHNLICKSSPPSRPCSNGGS